MGVSGKLQGDSMFAVGTSKNRAITKFKSVLLPCLDGYHQR